MSVSVPTLVVAACCALLHGGKQSDLACSIPLSGVRLGEAEGSRLRPEAHCHGEAEHSRLGDGWCSGAGLLQLLCCDKCMRETLLLLHTRCPNNPLDPVAQGRQAHSRDGKDLQGCCFNFVVFRLHSSEAALV